MTDSITRAQLVQVAKRAIEMAEDRGRPISGDVEEACLSVARAVPRVCGRTDWWLEEEACGCLAGWILREHHADLADDDPYSTLGITYLYALDEVLPETDAFSRARVVAVVD